MIPNKYAPNHKAFKYINYKPTELEEENDRPKGILRNSNTALLVTASATRQRISKYTEDLRTLINLT